MDTRQPLCGMFWVLDYGAKWKDLPREIGTKTGWVTPIGAHGPRVPHNVRLSVLIDQTLQSLPGTDRPLRGQSVAHPLTSGWPSGQVAPRTGTT